MRLFLATLTLTLALGATALAQSGDLRAPDQVAPAPVVTQDLRAPDQVAPAPVVTQDLRAPDQVAPAPGVTSAPKIVASAPKPAPDGGWSAIVFVLIGGAALLLIAGGYFGVRYRHRVAIADDLVVE